MAESGDGMDTETSAKMRRFRTTDDSVILLSEAIHQARDDKNYDGLEKLMRLYL